MKDRDGGDARPRRSGGSILSSLISIAIFVLCLRNVFVDDTLALASQAACGGRPGCSAWMSKGLKTPVGHFYHFQVAGQEVEIECIRAYFLEGEYACNDKAHGLFARLSASASAAPSASAPPAMTPAAALVSTASPGPAPKTTIPASKPRK